MQVRFLATAREELREAVRYYNAQREGLGAEFVREMVAALDHVRSLPNAAPKMSKQSRRFRLKRFPYGLVYRVRADYVQVLAVMHLHRRPGYWRDREKLP